MKYFLIIGACIASFLGVNIVHAATLSVGPTSGTYSAGSTFDVSIFLNTENASVNAIEVALKFPPDKLQLVSPSTGQSIIDIWTGQPKFNNQTGEINLQGGMLGGTNVSKGLITTLTFRVKSTGSATLRFLDSTKALLNDGLGTDVLYQKQDGVYHLILPPPEGPIVASETHPEQSRWYPFVTPIFTWATESDVDGYSYTLSREPIDIPDDTSEGIRNSVAYKNLSDGVHYFHIKALREGIWGGITHFGVQIDSSSPAEFLIEIIPSAKTTSREPIVKFQTTDAHSGISHYELKVVLVGNIQADTQSEREGTNPFFIEVTSPYSLPEMELGKYDVIVRVHDKAGNFLDVTERVHITDAIFQFVGRRGLEIKNVFIIPWVILWLILIALIALLALAGLGVKRWHHDIGGRGKRRGMSEEVKKKLEELKNYQKKYGSIHSIIFLILAGTFLWVGTPVFAQDTSFNPPFVTTVSKNISNEEIFYIGGKTDAAHIEVVIYFQNLQTGETKNETVVSDKRGDWFYRHDALLSSGDYLLWVQSKLGELVSPPSPQIQLSVRATAIQFGASRVSYEVLYLSISIFLFIVLLGAGGYALFHARTARRKHKEFMREMREAEESIRRGFAVLKRDIQAELAIIKRARLGKELSKEQHVQEEQLLKDLAWAESYIGKEVWDVAETEHHD